MQHTKSALLFSLFSLFLITQNYAQIGFVEGRVIYNLPDQNNIPLDAGELADFTGDGRLDYLFTISEFGNSDLYLLEQDAEGVFQAALLEEGISTVVQVSDFDDDGNPDYLSTSNVFLNNGMNGFAAAESGYPVITDDQERILFEAGDLNGDGIIDYATGSNQSIGGDSLFVYFGMAGGDFQTVGVAAADIETAGRYNLFGEFQDVTSRGILSVAEDYVTIYNISNSELSEVATINDPRIEEKAAVIGDIDGDGDNDVILAGLFSGIYLWEHEGSAYANALETISSTAARVLSMELADLEGDGDLDLITYGGGTDLEIVVYENIGGTITSNAQVIYSNSLQSSFFFAFANAFENLIEIADMDNDSDLDIVIYDYENDQIVLLENISMPSGLWSVIVEPMALSVFPNPSAGPVQIQRPAIDVQWQDVSLYNQEGRMLQQWSTLPEHIDLSRLPVGEYILMATSLDQQQFRARLVRMAAP